MAILLRSAGARIRDDSISRPSWRNMRSLATVQAASAAVRWACQYGSIVKSNRSKNASQPQRPNAAA